MFERFTETARQAVVLAQEEARVLEHGYIGTEHMLLGVLRSGGAGARTLEQTGATTSALRRAIVDMVGRGEGVTTGQIPFTPAAKQALELSLREALALGHNYIGSEHLLLGLLREPEGVAVQLLNQLEVEHDDLRPKILQHHRQTREGHFITAALAKRAVGIAANASATAGRSVDPGDLVIAFAEVDDVVRTALTRFISLDDLAAALDEARQANSDG